MDDYLAVFGIFLILAFIGSVLGWVTFFQLKAVAKKNEQLKKEMDSLKLLLASSNTDVHTTASAPLVQQSTPGQDIDWYKELQPTDRIESIQKASVDDEEVSLEISLEGIKADVDKDKSQQNESSVSKNKNDIASSFFEKLFQNAATHWMVWVGGASIGFSGVFLVKYSMDNNLLGPEARILLALLVGALLHIGAYRLHRLKGQYDAFAALAGGGSLILYSALLAALHLYNLLSPNWVFALLLLVSLVTMLLALRYGPVLAAIGILGSYLIPIFVSTGSNNLVGALVYSFIITVSALLLIRYVSRTWLWLGTLFGAGFWWLLSLTSGAADIPRLLYLVALTYAVVAIDQWDWRLLARVGERKTSKLSVWELFKGNSIDTEGTDRKSVYFVLLVSLLASVVSIWTVGLSLDLSWLILLYPLLMLWLSFNHNRFLPIAWLSFLAVITGIFLPSFFWENLFEIVAWPLEVQKTHLLFLLALAVMYSGTAYVAIKTSDKKYYWSSLGFIAPLALLMLGFVLTRSAQTSWQWALVAGLVGAFYFNILYRKRETGLSPEIHAVLILAGHLAYSLAAVMLAREATLTLALAVQLISLVWVDRYFRLPILPYLIKGILAVIIFRLTLNPWLLTYATDTHWSLWTYGGSLICCIAAAYLLKNRDDLMRWLQAAALHLFVLAVIAETRYQLYAGDIFVEHYSFFEAAFYTLLLGVTGLVYKIRARFSQTLVWFYDSAAVILLLGAVANHTIFILLFNNPLFVSDTVSSTPIWNILLLAYGAPCLIAGLAILLSKNEQWQRITGVVATVSLLIFVSIEVRHVWHGELDIGQPMLAGELYTYSMVWLSIAIIGSLLSIRYRQRDLYRASMLFLMVLVAKIFLIDTSGLSSLWRVGSFLGLGLSLLGLSYFHQKIGADFKHATTQEPGDDSTGDLTESVDKA